MRERKLIVFHGETLTASVQPLVRVSASSVLLKLSAVLSAPGRPTYVLVLSRPTEINRDRAWNLFVWDSSIRRWRKSCLTGARGLNSEILGTSREKGHPEATGNLPGSSWRLFASKLDQLSQDPGVGLIVQVNNDRTCASRCSPLHSCLRNELILATRYAYNDETDVEIIVATYNQVENGVFHKCSFSKNYQHV